MDEAIKIQTELEAMERRPSPWGMAMFYAALGEKEKGLQELQTMYDSGHAWTPWITAPQFEPLHDDPRYREILRGLNLPDS